jgi:hypothetical protein
LIDSHNHTFGHGALIPTAAININASLSFNNVYAATNLAYVQLNYSDPVLEPNSAFADQSGNLWFSNGAGVPVQITSGNSLAGASGTITGLVAPASASFDVGTGTFTFMQNGTQHALMDTGPLKLRTTAAGSNFVELTPASGTANYTLTLPAALPSGASLVGVGSSGALSNVSANSTLTVTSSSISIANLGVTEAYIATDAVTTTKIKNGNVTPQKLSAVVQANSSRINFAETLILIGPSSAQFSPTINFFTFTNRPIIVMLRPDDTTIESRIKSSSLSPGLNADFIVYLDVIGPAGEYSAGQVLLSGNTNYAPSSLMAYIIPPSGGGGYSFTGYVKLGSSSAGAAIEIQNCILTAYSL